MTGTFATFLRMLTPTSHASNISSTPEPSDTPTPRPIAPYVDAERFAADVEQARGLALVDFTADWCPPCRVLAPHIDALARELSGRVTVAKVNVDDQPALAARFGVMSMPTLLFFRDGAVVDRIIGAVPAALLRARLDALAAA
jgi:thioredoxin 1